MASDKQIEANRNNSLHSTGPKTEAGKRTSSQNAFKHGLAAEEFCHNGESYESYKEAFSDMLAEYNATSTGDKYLVEQILQGHILAQRARHTLLEACIAAERGNPQPAGYDETRRGRDKRPAPPSYIESVALIVRYLTQHERSIVRANDMLHKNRKLLPTPQPTPVESIVSAPIGFVPEREILSVRQPSEIIEPALDHPQIAA